MPAFDDRVVAFVLTALPEEPAVALTLSVEALTVDVPKPVMAPLMFTVPLESVNCRNLLEVAEEEPRLTVAAELAR